MNIKNVSVYIGLFLMLTLVTGCLNDVVYQSVLHKPFPQQGHFALLIFTGNHAEIKEQIEDQYDDFFNHKLNTVTESNDLYEKDLKFYDVTEFPTFIIYDHEKEVFRTNEMSEALEYIDNL
mgnify:CR=1 FL=1